MPALGLIAASALIAVASSQPSNTYVLNGGPSLGGVTFDGVGASFTGAAARFIFEYDDDTQNAILDYLFAPSGAPSTASSFKGAALQIIKLEIGAGANTGFGSEPSFMPSGTDSPDTSVGWLGQLALAAVQRNPGIKIMVTPLAFPQYLVFDPSAPDPFDNAFAVANYVAQFVQSFSQRYAVTISHVGVWGAVSGSRLGPADDARQSSYVQALRKSLNDLSLTGVQIVCADASSWACASAVDGGDPSLAAAVGVIGNSGTPNGAQLASAKKGLKPTWVTDFSRVNARADGAMAVASSIFSSFLTVDSKVSGWIFGTAVSTAPYGFPGYHLGLIDASQPWSGHFTTTPPMWAIAQFTQFVPVGWKIAPEASQASGTLVNCGNFMTFYDPQTFDFVLLLYKGRDCEDEIATFQLADLWAELSIPSVDVWFSSFNGKSFPLPSPSPAGFSSLTCNNRASCPVPPLHRLHLRH